MSFRIRLADGWRDFHRKSSVRFSAAIAVLSPMVPALEGAWSRLPDDLKAYLPTGMKQAISYIILAGIFLTLRYTTIERKTKEPEQ